MASKITMRLPQRSELNLKSPLCITSRSLCGQRCHVMHEHCITEMRWHDASGRCPVCRGNHATLSLMDQDVKHGHPLKRSDRMFEDEELPSGATDGPVEQERSIETPGSRLIIEKYFSRTMASHGHLFGMWPRSGTVGESVVEKAVRQTNYRRR